MGLIAKQPNTVSGNYKTVVVGVGGLEMVLTVSSGTSSVIGDWVVVDSLRVFAPQHQPSKADTSIQKLLICHLEVSR